MEKNFIYEKDLPQICLSGLESFCVESLFKVGFHLHVGILHPFSEVFVHYLDLLVEMCGLRLASLAFFVHLCIVSLQL